MPLYQVQDSDCFVFVIAESFEDAIQKWRKRIQEENPEDDRSGCQPEGVHYLAEDDEVIL